MPELVDPRPPKRIKATRDQWIDIEVAKRDRCRICETTFGTSFHHIVPKSLGGDDLKDNIVPLCGDGVRGCHGLVEARDPEACATLGDRLSAAERAYVLGKKGPAFLARYYGRREAA